MSLVHGKEQAAFIKNQCFRGIQIFGPAVIEHTAAKTNDASPAIAYRKHDPVAKGIVVPAVFFFSQSDFNELRPGYTLLFEGIGQFIPTVRGKSQLKRINRIIAQVPAMKIGKARFAIVGLYQTVMKEVTCQFINFKQAVPVLIPRNIICGLFYFRQWDMGPFSQSFYRFTKRDVFFHHNEFENIPVGMAAKTIIESFISSDTERSRFSLWNGQHAQKLRPRRWRTR